MYTFAVEMYRCELCEKVVAPNVPSTRVTVETRPATYPFRADANRPVKRGKDKKKPDDRGGRGTEIVRERVACPACAGNGGTE
jgi:hypothetical protein